MPFIVQCPHADCRRYMLLEDEVRGTTVNCLLCAKPIRVDGSGVQNAPPANTPAAPPPRPQAVMPPAPTSPAPPMPPPVQQPPMDDKLIVTCPNPMCKSPLKVAPAMRGTQLRCPRCKQVFKA